MQRPAAGARSNSAIPDVMRWRQKPRRWQHDVAGLHVHFLESIIQRGAHGVALFFWVDGALSLGLGFVLLAEVVLLFAPRAGVQRLERLGDGALR